MELPVTGNVQVASMTPFSNQFSLSLELTRLVPLGIAASDAVMNLARSLRNSGSDIVIEEDLATVFGRCRISPHMTTSFRTLVARSDSSILSRGLGMVLEAGPGPTVSLLLCSRCLSGNVC